jgi:hypothetical protein
MADELVVSYEGGAIADVTRAERDALRDEVEWWKSAHDTCCSGADKLVTVVERLRALIGKHNDECRECPVIEPA